MGRVRRAKQLSIGLLLAGELASCLLIRAATGAREPKLDRLQLAKQHFGADAAWFADNIPLLEIDDPEIEQIYYYRWKLFRSHIREIGPQGTTVLEFLDNVGWARQPYTDLNDSASFHLLEGRWLRSPATVDRLIEHLYAGGGNDRRFSESIAAATEGTTLVTGSIAPALRQLSAMEYVYNQWDDHFDRNRNLYWIEPLPDATEYTVSSIDASGAGFSETPSKDQNHNGFTGGYAFRPSINSYQYGNAMAIARLADRAGEHAVAATYFERAERLRKAILEQLWNPKLQHFSDRYQRSTDTVTEWNFIRSRELVGYLPWFYEIPPQSTPTDYSQAWRHLLDPTELGGFYGMRTVEPSYPRYMTQYRYDQPTGLPECQWNGPSWPFQSSQALTAMANLLDDYPAAGVSVDDYVRLLRQYTHQHLLEPGHPDLQEDYNPDTGKPIVGLPRSHHYNHSTYIDLILSGLIGVRPQADDVLEVSPLLPSSVPAASQSVPIRYFALERLRYHGHEVGVVYDVDGSRYHIGAGLSVFVDGRRVSGPGPLHRVRVPLARAAALHLEEETPVDLLANPGLPEGPIASASSTAEPGSIAEGNDGRLWFFPENPNGWSPGPGPASWYAVDMRQPQRIGSVELNFFADASGYRAPSKVQIQVQTANGWHDLLQQSTQTPVANGNTRINFAPVVAQKLRVLMSNPASPYRLRLIEVKAFAP